MISYTQEVSPLDRDWETSRTTTQYLHTEPTDFPSVSGFCASKMISRKTFYEWVSKYEEFGNSYEIAKEFQKNIIMINGLKGLYNPIFAQFLCRAVCEIKEDGNDNETTVKVFVSGNPS